MHSVDVSVVKSSLWWGGPVAGWVLSSVELKELVSDFENSGPSSLAVALSLQDSGGVDDVVDLGSVSEESEVAIVGSVDVLLHELEVHSLLSSGPLLELWSLLLGRNKSALEVLGHIVIDLVVVSPDLHDVSVSVVTSSSVSVSGTLLEHVIEDGDGAVSHVSHLWEISLVTIAKWVWGSSELLESNAVSLSSVVSDNFKFSLGDVHPGEPSEEESSLVNSGEKSAPFMNYSLVSLFDSSESLGPLWGVNWFSLPPLVSHLGSVLTDLINSINWLQDVSPESFLLATSPSSIEDSVKSLFAEWVIVSLLRLSVGVRRVI